MKRILLVFLTFLLVSIAFGQSIPQSKIIDSKQLLHDLEILSADNMEGRMIGTIGGEKAREYVLKRFQESDIKSFGDSYLQPFEFSYPRKPEEIIKGANVIGYIKGTENPEKYIVITAHYDHIGVKKGDVYNGADDNASGTAALFALAKYFHKNRPSNSLIFGAFDGEEGGLRGAKKFIAEPPVKKEAMILNINMDMICRDKNNILYAVGTYHYPFLRYYLEKISAKSQIKLLMGHDNPNEKNVENWTNDSDHAAFHKEKIPFIYFGVEDYENHHQPTDDFATITTEFYIHAVETIIEAVKVFDENLAEIEKQKVK